MRCAVQRRTVVLAPLQQLDGLAVVRAFAQPDVYAMFGFDEPAPQYMAYRLKDDLISGAIRLAQGNVKIGFALMFPPTDTVGFWEFGFAITEPRQRNAYHALNTMDAMAHYMLDIQGVPLVGGRIRQDNRAAAAIALRAGHRPQFTREHGAHTYTFYTLDADGWRARKEKLARVPGPLFHVINHPPYRAVDAGPASPESP